MTTLGATSGDQVIQDISHRWTKFEWSKVTLWAAIIFGLVGFGTPVLFFPAVLFGGATWYLHDLENRIKTVHLTYDLDPGAQAAYDRMVRFWNSLSTSARLWSILTNTETSDYKRNAGASSLVQRKSVSLSKASPRFLTTNVPVYALTTGRFKLYFLPDRLLVQARGGVTACPYDRLKVVGGHSQFIESETVPRDAQVVGHTWRYVNKNGGPDRRFNNNRQLPICLYGSIVMSSLPGLHIELQCSNPHLAAGARESFGQFSGMAEMGRGR